MNNFKFNEISKMKRHYLIILSIALIPLWIHAAWILNIHILFTEIQKEDIVIMDLPRQGAADPNIYPIQIIGTFGDIFEPKQRSIDRSYDLLILSATIDPLSTVNETIQWESNLLVRSFFSYAYEDEALVESGVRNLIFRMQHDNEEFLEYISSEPVQSIQYNQDYASELCEPFIAKVPEDSRLYEEGIRWYAVLPIFNSKNISSSVERDDRLALNVKISLSRLLNDLAQLERDSKEYRIRVIAVPALAGSEMLQDSQYYLKYSDSYESIISAVRGIPLPKSLERVYLVSWDKWEYLLPEENKCSIAGLREVYSKFTYPLIIKYIAYSVLFSFGIAYMLFWYQSEKSSQNLTWLNHFQIVIIFILIQLGNIFTIGGWITNILLFIYKLGSTTLLVTSEIFIGSSSVFFAYKTEKLMNEYLKKLDNSLSKK